jgi:conserved oligomeric Golgi complex subunit 1
MNFLIMSIDSQLRALQSLAAHVKLLLDAPEHLWRLLEHKKYLHASWLFMLARVVHRSLANDDPSEEEGWYNQGIDVLVCSLPNFHSVRTHLA